MIDLIYFIESIVRGEETPKLDPNSKSTFFSISGFPHYENVMSNWLAFYFDSSQAHGFETLFSKALSHTISQQISNVEWLEDGVYSMREVMTKNQGFIDIVLYDDGDPEKLEFENCVIIEHKIGATLNNELNDYYESVQSKDSKTGVVFSAYSIDSDNKNFINITYETFLKSLRPLIGEYIEQAESKYLLYLTDLIDNLEHLSESMNTEKIDFCYKYGKEVTEIAKLKEAAESQLMEQVRLELNNSAFRFHQKHVRTFTVKSHDDKVTVYFQLEGIFSEQRSDFEVWIRDEWVHSYLSIPSLNKVNEFLEKNDMKPMPVKTGAKEWLGLSKGVIEFNDPERSLAQSVKEILVNTVLPMIELIKSEMSIDP